MGEAEIKETEEVQHDKEKLVEIHNHKCESNDTSPFSQTSPRSTTSSKSESLASSPGPDDKDEMEERMKPWKKRKIVQDHHHDDLDIEQKGPEEKIAKKEEENTTENTDSQVYQEQLDPSTSGSDH